MFSLIRFILTIVWGCVSLSWSMVTYAESGASLDMTSDSFRIPTQSIDPIRTGGSVPGGVDAIRGVIESVANILLFILPILGGILIILAGYYYIFSGGDSERTSTAKKILKYNLIALTVGFLSYSLVKIIASFF